MKPSANLIVAIGHSIVQYPDCMWIPSDPIQEITEHDGVIERTYIHNPGLDPDAPTAYLGGGQAVVQALARLWQRDLCDVAIVGGRPKAMDKRFGVAVKDISEASVMAKHLETFFQGTAPEVMVIGGTSKTEDDVQELLELKRRYDYRSATVVVMSFRLARCQLILDTFARRGYGMAAHGVHFVSAEQYLPERLDEFERIRNSAAWRRTMTRERAGVEALLEGRTDYARAL